MYTKSKLKLLRIVPVVIPLVIILLFFGSTWVVSWLTKNYTVAENVSDEEIIEVINSATEIYLHRNRPSINDSYDVVIDGEKICEIKGVFVKMFWNENLEMTSVNGNVLYTVEENWGILRSNWSVFNSNGDVLVSLREKVSLMNNYDILDQENSIGTLNANWFSFWGNSYILDNDNNKIFIATRDIAGSTTIKCIDNSKISNVCALMMIIGENSMNEKSNNKSSNSSSKN